MRICFFDFNLNFGGAAQGSLFLLSRLKAEGFDVAVIDAYGKNAEYQNKADEYGLSFKVLTPKAKNTFIGYHGYKRFLHALAQAPSFVRLLYRLMTSLKEMKPNNEEIYSHRLYADQIVPLSISSLFHFGFLGIFFYSSFFLSIALYFERLSNKIQFIGYKFICINLSIVFSLVFMLNIGSFYASLSRTILFVFLPIFVIHNLQNLKVNKQLKSSLSFRNLPR